MPLSIADHLGAAAAAKVIWKAPQLLMTSLTLLETNWTSLVMMDDTPGVATKKCER